MKIKKYLIGIVISTLLSSCNLITESFFKPLVNPTNKYSYLISENYRNKYEVYGEQDGDGDTIQKFQYEDKLLLIREISRFSSLKISDIDEYVEKINTKVEVGVTNFNNFGKINIGVGYSNVKCDSLKIVFDKNTEILWSKKTTNERFYGLRLKALKMIDPCSGKFTLIKCSKEKSIVNLLIMKKNKRFFMIILTNLGDDDISVKELEKIIDV